MTIRIIYYTAEDRKAHGDMQMRRKSELFTDHNFTFENSFSVREEKDNWFLTPLSDEPLFCDGVLIEEEVKVSNGYTFNSSNTFYKLVHDLSYVPRSSLGSIISILTFIIISLILFSELFLVVWLPKKWSELADLSKQVMVQQSEGKIDAVRHRFRNKRKDETTSQRAASSFLFKEMNRIADYFRENRTVMSVEEVRSMYSRILMYDKLADMLDEGLDFDKKIKPNISLWVDENCKGKNDEQ